MNKLRLWWIWPFLLVLVVCGGAGALAVRFLTTKAKDVVRIAHEDPALQAAIKTARKELPQFTHRLKDHADGERFAVKAKLFGKIGNEYLWVKNPVIQNGGFKGTLDQQPAGGEGNKGDQIFVPTANVVDWLIMNPDKSLEGGYTDKALGAAVR